MSSNRSEALSRAIELCKVNGPGILADDVVTVADKFLAFLDSAPTGDYRYFRFRDSNIYYRARNSGLAERRTPGYDWTTEYSNSNPRTLDALILDSSYEEIKKDQVR